MARLPCYGLAAMLEKQAASRLDKEVARGNVSYSDVSGHIPAPLGKGRYGKYLSRIDTGSATPVAPELLTRRRRLHDAVFRNQHAVAQKNQKPSPFKIDLPDNLKSDTIDYFPEEGLHNKSFERMGPATHVSREGFTAVYAPDTAGQILRGLQGDEAARLGVQRAVTVDNSGLLPRKEVDSTLNRGVLEHEFGEAAVGRQGAHHPHATHLGVEPILRENLILQGDPEAQAIMRGARQLGPDDALVARLSKQIGYHPDSALPIGGRAQRALERALVRNRDKLDKSGQGALFGRQITNDMALAEARAILQAPPGTYTPEQAREALDLIKNKGVTNLTLPEEARAASQRLAPKVKEFMNNKPTGSFWNRARGYGKAIREMAPDAWAAYKSMR